MLLHAFVAHLDGQVVGMVIMRDEQVGAVLLRGSVSAEHSELDTRGRELLLFITFT